MAIKTVISEIPFDQLNLPELVYKYRFWDDTYPFHKSILTEQRVFFASPLTFEDSVDCKNLVRYDLMTEQDIYDSYLWKSHEQNKNFNEDQHREFAKEWTSKSPLRKMDYVKVFMQKSFEQLCQRFGVLCLTEKPALFEMWKKYSGDHTGICVGFEARGMFKYFGGGGKVDYYDKLPDIFPQPKHSLEQQIMLQVFSKERKWEFEQEYRVHKLYPKKIATKEDRTIQLPKETIKEVIIGARTSEKSIKEIEKWIKTQLPHVKIRRAKIILGDLIEIA